MDLMNGMVKGKLGNLAQNEFLLLDEHQIFVWDGISDEGMVQVGSGLSGELICLMDE